MDTSAMAPIQAVLYSAPHDFIPPARQDDDAVVPVFLCCDDKFLPHALEVIASFMAHAAPENFYDIFIVQEGIPSERLNIAASWIQRYENASLRFVDIGPKIAEIKKSFTITKEYSAAVYFRFFAPGIFTAYDKMIYLDSDIAVLDDIAGFYRQELGEMPLGAVEDLVSMHQSTVNPFVTTFWRTQLGKEPGEKSFFSGGLVMNLKQLRAEDFEQAMLARIPCIKESKLPDQDVMNAVLNNRIVSISCEWNCLDWMFDPEEEAHNFKLLSEAGRMTIREARPHAKVIHYAERKPWTIDYQGKFAEFYWMYAEETPFYEEVIGALLRDGGMSNVIKKRLIMYLQQGNFWLRQLPLPDDQKAKYQARIRNLRWRMKGLSRHIALIKKINKDLVD